MEEHKKKYNFDRRPIAYSSKAIRIDSYWLEGSREEGHYLLIFLNPSFLNYQALLPSAVIWCKKPEECKVLEVHICTHSTLNFAMCISLILSTIFLSFCELYFSVN